MEQKRDLSLVWTVLVVAIVVLCAMLSSNERAKEKHEATQERIAKLYK